MLQVRPPAVAGTFYPAEPEELRAMVREYLAAAGSPGPVPIALIVPHAGYPYSAAVAAAAYGRLAACGAAFRRAVLVGPAHRAPVRGVATSSAQAFATPLGTVTVDRSAITSILTLSRVAVDDAAHASEHSLEVQLPFLQTALPDFSLVPLLVGDATPREVLEVLEVLRDGPETLVVSTDLSHYLDYGAARRLDLATSRAIEALQSEDIRPHQACGWTGLVAILDLARRHGLRAETLDVRNSGDTGGPRHKVVGYGAYAVVSRHGPPGRRSQAVGHPLPGGTIGCQGGGLSLPEAVSGSP
ncbi:MAG TPA: AmmeMemoRadiSam system protein B [Clostridiales bacterium]|nr:AmmeMemoRadiSam system protein B [Clostridiales bacterium]